MDGLDSLLLNVLFLIVFLLFIPFLVESSFKSPGSTQKKQWVMTITAGLAIISCISFPITLIEGYIFDLRLIAIVIGGLYGGFQSILFLGVLTVSYRFFVGGFGAIATIIIVPTVCILLLATIKAYHASSRKKKIIMGSGLSSCAALLAVLNSVFLFGVPFSGLFVFIYVLFITSIAIIYIYEWITETILINQRILKAEKLEIISHLASSISHEVRNPLAVIKGFLQIMEQTAPETLAAAREA